MKNVLILGASGNIAGKVIDLLAEKENINLTLFLRKAGRLRNRGVKNSRIVEGNVLNINDVEGAMAGIDIVYINLAGDLESMAKNIVKAMQDKGVKRIILISSIKISDTPLRSALIPYRKAVDVVEASGLEYTILRPTWFTNANEIDYELTQKGKPEKGSVISQKSLATFIAEIIEHPEIHVNENLGINKPNS
jgi:uncharacterized protein YbjT (DUF2867 family)